MSILIKGMEMPKKGEYHMTLYVDSDSAYIDVESFPEDKDKFEVVEVPPHGRLIDADELMRRIQLYIDEYELYVDENGFHCEKWCAMKETEMAINDAPTVIPADKDGVT